MHQNNNLWDFPLFNTGSIPKWEPSADKPNEVFDLCDIFYKQGIAGYQFVAHGTPIPYACCVLFVCISCSDVPSIQVHLHNRNADLLF
jgi:hypothetical protein